MKGDLSLCTARHSQPVAWGHTVLVRIVPGKVTASSAQRCRQVHWQPPFPGCHRGPACTATSPECWRRRAAPASPGGVAPARAACAPAPRRGSPPRGCGPPGSPAPPSCTRRQSCGTTWPAPGSSTGALESDRAGGCVGRQQACEAAEAAEGPQAGNTCWAPAPEGRARHKAQAPVEA